MQQAVALFARGVRIDQNLGAALEQSHLYTTPSESQHGKMAGEYDAWNTYPLRGKFLLEV